MSQLRKPDEREIGSHDKEWGGSGRSSGIVGRNKRAVLSERLKVVQRHEKVPINRSGQVANGIEYLHSPAREPDLLSGQPAE